MTVYWHVQGNSQEMNAGGSSYAASYVKKYQALCPVPVSLVEYIGGSRRWPEFKAQQASVLANLVPGSLNVLSTRPASLLDPDFASLYGGSIDNWAADVISVMQTYLNAGMRICLLTSFIGNTPNRRYIMDALMVSWVGRYVHAVADLSHDPINSDDVGLYAAHPNEMQPDGHFKDPGQDLVLSYFQPAMDRVVRPSFFSRA